MALEIEKTYLAKNIPPNLEASHCDEVEDIHLLSVDGLGVRARRKGKECEFTIKRRIGNDASRHSETTVEISLEKFKELAAEEVRRIRKCRYSYLYNGLVADVDVFLDSLEGLVVIDFEFKSVEDKDGFQMPDFCLADVTSEKFIVGGNLAGKSYAEIEPGLNRFGYKPLRLK